MSIYTYSLAADFPSGLNKSQLHGEVSANGGITQMLATITQKNDTVTLYFAGSLTGGEVTILNGIVAAHVPASISTSDIVANSLKSATTTIDIDSAAAPTTGQVLRATPGTAATWQTFPIFGTGYFYNSSLPETNTTSLTFQQKLRLTTGSLVAGNYRIAWFYLWRHSSTSASFRGRVQIDDTTTLMEHYQEPQDAAATQRHSVSGFVRATLTAGVHDIDLDYATAAAGTSSISNCHLEIWRVE